jgi:glycosyltransferase involved in cell wall biosynthesis
MQSNNPMKSSLDDGSTDNSWSIIEQFAAENPNVKGIRFMKNFGKSQALHAGFAKAQGEVIITMDADLQDSPEEIPGLYNMITSQNLIWFPVGRKKLRFSKTYLQNYSTGRLKKRLG